VNEDEDDMGEDEEDVDVEDGVDEFRAWVKDDAADEVIVGSANKSSVPENGAQAIMSRFDLVHQPRVQSNKSLPQANY
jgi:hypothetical protein